MKPDAILIDIDGTLLDSNDAHARAWVEALQRHGRQVPYDTVRSLIGKGGDKLLQETVGLDAEEGEGKRIGDARRALFVERELPHLQPTRGARALLERLKREGRKLVIATSASGEELQALLRQAGVEDLIDEASSSQDADASKPDPDIVIVALKKAGVAAGRAVMLGDTPYDIESARKAGVATIALRCGGNWDDAAFRGAIAIHDDPAALLAAWDTLTLPRRTTQPRPTAAARIDRAGLGWQRSRADGNAGCQPVARPRAAAGTRQVERQGKPMSPPTQPPVLFDPSVEQIDADEHETAAAINATMGKIRAKTYADSGHAIRSVHAKSQGFVIGQLTVADGLPPELAQGLFAKPGSYPVVMRFSTIPGDILDDNVSTPRGLAVKVIGVAGEQLSGAGATQDFVLVNGPAFNAPNAKKFLSSLKLLAATTDKAEGAKKALSSTLQVVEKVIETFGGKSTTLTTMGGQAETHVLGETYFSQAPIRFGAYIAKIAVAPASAALTALTDAPVDLNGKPNGLREAVCDFFVSQGGEWHLQAQLCTDLDTMPIEDASVEWPQEQSPYVTVARITAAPQQAWSEARAAAIDDGMLFTPWHGLVAHQPLGGVMRARKLAYQRSADFRAEHNGRQVAEPTSVDALL